MTVDIAIISSMLLFSILFSGLEISLVSLSPFHTTRKNRNRVVRLVKKREALISTMLIGNNISIIYATLVLDHILVRYVELWIRIIIFAGQLIVFFFIAEVLPKHIFRRFSHTIAIHLYGLIWGFYFFLYPLNYLLGIIKNLLLRFVPEAHHNKKEDILHFVGNTVLSENLSITNGLLSLSKTKASELMTPSTQIFSIDGNAKVDDALTELQRTSYTRYPVYKGRGDNITGYITVYDLLRASKNTRIETISHEAVYVPEIMSAEKLYFKMQNEQLTIVFIVNEFGAVTGMITMENIAEQILGRELLSKEQISEKPYINKLKPGLYQLDGNLDIDDFNEYFTLSVQKTGFETITGYIFHLTGAFPGVGEKIPTKHGVLLIEKSDNKTIHSVLFEPAKKVVTAEL